jgi:tape measure domain-containing protein
VGEVAIEGDDSARSKLSMVSKAVDQTQHDMTSKLASAARSTGTSFLDFGSKMGMVALGFKTIIDGAVSLGQSLFSPVANAEQLGIAFTTLMGSTKAATKEIKELNHFADLTPFEPDQVQQYAAQLIGMKINADKTIPIMTALGDALYGIGHGTPAEMKSVVDIIGKISIQGRMTGEDLTQMGEHGIDALGAIALGSGMTQDALRQMASNGGIPASLAIDGLTKGIELNPLYQGGMAKQANSAAGIFSTLSGYVRQATNSFLGLKDGQVVAGGLFDLLKTGFANLSAWVQNPVFQEFAATLGQKLGGAIKTVVGLVTQLASNSQILTPVLAGLGAILVALIVPAVASLAVSVVLATWPLLAIGVAVAGLVAGFMALYQKSAPFRTFIDGLRVGFQQLWTIISANFLPTMSQLGQLFQTVGAFLITTFKPAWDQLVTTFNTQIKPAWDDLMRAMQPAIPFFRVILAGVLALIVGQLAGLAQALSALFQGLAQALGGVIQIISGVLQVLGGIISFFVHLFTGQFDKLGGDLFNIWNGIATFFIGIWNVIAGIFRGAFGAIWGYVSGFVQGVIGFFQSLASRLVGHSIVPDMINSIVNFFTQLPGRAVSAISGLAGQIGGVFTALAASALQWGTNILNQVAQGIRNGIASAIQAVQDFVGQVAKYLPHSPAELGPLRFLAEQGEEITGQVASGILAGIPKLNSVLDSLSTPITTNVSAVASGSSVAYQPPALRAAQPTIIVQSPPIYLDGRQLASGLMPYVVNQIRYGV